MTGVLNMNGNKITGVASGDQPSDVVTNADIADLGVAIGDGKFSLRDLSPNWLPMDGSLYLRSAYPELADLLPILPDGVQWSNISAGPAGYKRLHAYEDFYLMGVRIGTETNSYVYKSTDGIVYSQVDDISDFVINTTFSSGLGIHIIGGGDGKVSVSNDGSIWSSPVVAISGTPIYAVAAAFGYLFAAGNGGNISRSSDGTTWSAVASGVTQTIFRIKLVNGVLVGVGNTGTIISSTDGVNWTQRTSGVAQSLWDITYGNSLYVAVGDNGVIITSPDLVNWTSRTSGTTTAFRAVEYSSAGFIATGQGGIARISAANSGTAWASSATGVTGSLLDIVISPTNPARYYVPLAGSTSILTGVRTLSTQFQVPNEGDNQWIRAL
jgi:hypothetical protein